MLKKIFYIAVVTLGVIGVAATMVAALVSTGISAGVVLPGCAGCVLVAWGLAHIFRPGPIIKVKWLKIVLTVIICVGLLSFVAVETAIIAFADSARPGTEVNFVIVPGCGIFPDGRLTLTLQYRLDTAYDYLASHKSAVCIVSGGRGKNEPYPEARAMKDYLVSRGIDPSRIAEESGSYNTLENMVKSKNVMEKQYSGRQKTAVVITSGFHVLRAVTLAKYSGIKAYGIPAPTPWYIAINDYMREYAAILKMALVTLK